MDVLLVAVLVAGGFWIGWMAGFYKGHKAGEEEQKLRQRLDELPNPWGKP